MLILSRSQVARARPSSTITVGNWRQFPGGTGLNLHLNVDEAVADDSDFIAQLPGGGGSLCRINLGLGMVGAPALSRRHALLIRGLYTPGGGGSFTFNYDLRDNATIVKSETGLALPADFQTLTFPLTPAEVATIVDYSNLNLFMSGTGAGLGTFAVSWVQFRRG